MRNAMTYAERLISQGTSETGNAYTTVGTYAGRHTVTEARRIWAEFRHAFGYVRQATPFVTKPEAQPKLGKSETPSFGLMLSAADAVNALVKAERSTLERVAGGTRWGQDGFRKVNVCPFATSGCIAVCVGVQGHGQFTTTQRARAIRTAFMLAYPQHAMVLIAHEIRGAVRKHGRINMRMNVTSDIRWELATPELFDMFGDTVTFYDYTAIPPRVRSDQDMPDGYTLTRSAKETHTVDDIREMVNAQATVAVPFRVVKGGELPREWFGMRVVDGDASDDRTRDPRAVLVGLRAKGTGMADTSGFVREPFDMPCVGCGSDAVTPCDPFCLSHSN